MLNNDGLKNLVTAVNSSIDPIANNSLLANDNVDRCLWYSNGGIASSIVDYWPELVGSGFELGHSFTDGLKQKELDNLTYHLLNRHEQLGTVKALIDLHKSVHLHPMRAIVINATGQSYKQPIKPGALVLSLSLISSDITQVVEQDSYMNKYIISNNEVDGSRLLVMAGRSSSNSDSYGQRYAPLIDSNTIIAEQLYAQAVNAGVTLLQKKNFTTMGIDGFNKGLSEEIAGEYSRKMMSIVQQLQLTNNILNVVLHDRKETDISMLERSLSGSDAIIDRARDYLLASCNNIPETRLFGNSRVGGLNKANDDANKTEAEANRLFDTRWKPLVKQLNSLLIKEPKSPSSRFANSVTISRRSSSGLTELEKARIELLKAQAAKLNKEAG